MGAGIPDGRWRLALASGVLLLLFCAGASGGQFDYVSQANTFGDAVRLPPGWGPLMLVFFRVVGVLIVFRGVILQYDLSNGGAHHWGAQPGAGRAVLASYLIGVLVWHADKTLAVISNTLPFVPDLSKVFLDH